MLKRDGWRNKLKGKLSENDIQEICGSLLKMTNAAEVAGGGPIWAVNGLVDQRPTDDQNTRISPAGSSGPSLWLKKISLTY